MVIATTAPRGTRDLAAGDWASTMEAEAPEASRSVTTITPARSRTDSAATSERPVT
jgi:hypothetical protein